MAKRRALPDRHIGSGYSNWDIRRTIREAENISRWNPWLTHEWIEEARNAMTLDKPFYSEFNQAASRINHNWVWMRQYTWFDETEFWSMHGESRGITLIELI